jgi:hypothetical protein
MIPETWYSLKIDLFDNATDKDLMLNKSKLKLSFAIKKHNEQTYRYYRAMMNSPIRNFKRGIGSDWDHKHYAQVRQHYDSIVADLGEDCEYIAASKCFCKGYAQKKHSVEGMSTILFRYDNAWYVELFLRNDRYTFKLTGANLSKSQRQNNMIASVLEKHKTVYSRTRVEDLL